MGDVGVFLRAGWAARTGESLYDVTCDNGWHYHYPPLFAILMMPLADPPPGAATAGFVPYPISVAIFYGLSLLWLGLAVHWLAESIEAAVPGLHAGPGSRRWLYLRTFPLWACLLPIGHSLSRGQVTTLWMLLMAGFVGGVVRGRRLPAGLCLAGCICLKIVPGYLLIYPVWRRDGRLLAGCILGLVLGLGVIPAVVMGPGASYRAYHQLAEVLIGPALGLGADQSRTTELLGVAATSNVSFQAIIHHVVYGITADPTRLVSPWVRQAHWLLGAALTVATLAAAGWRRSSDPWLEAIFLGALSLLNLLVSPVCHTLYFAMLAAPVAVLMALEWRRDDAGGRPSGFAGLATSWRLFGLAALLNVCNAVPIVPALEPFRNLGLPSYAVLLFWAVSCVEMLRLRRRPEAVGVPAAVRPAA
jgi:hypothetical protein